MSNIYWKKYSLEFILLKKLNENAIKKIYITLMFFAGAKMIFL